MSQIRVLHVLDQISLNSGVSSIAMNYYNFIDKNSVIFDFMVHAPVDRKLQEQLEKQGSLIYNMPYLNFKSSLSYIRALNQFFRQHHEYKIIHGHVPNAACFYLRAAKKHGVTVRILHAHSTRGSNNPIKRIRNYFLNKMGVKYASCYFACSKAAGKYLYGNRNVEKNKIYYLHNAIEIEKFQYNEQIRNKIRKQMNIAERFVIGHVGRFSAEKNHILLLDIFYEVLKLNPFSVLLLVGSGELEGKIREKVKYLQLNDNVIFTGVQSNVFDYMQAMDVFVLPSLFEGLPVVCIEAQAAGLPCVISDNVTRETDVTGTIQFINIENVNDWAKTIIDRKSVKRNNDQQIIIDSGYSIISEAKRLEKIYLNEFNISR